MRKKGSKEVVGAADAAPTLAINDFDEAKRLVNKLSEVVEVPKGAKFSAEYLLELEEKRLGLQQAASEFITGLEKYQWLIDRILAADAERKRLKPIDPEQLTNPVERALAFAQMASLANNVMLALKKESEKLVEVALKGVL
jgi:hypothetical protein